MSEFRIRRVNTGWKFDLLAGNGEGILSSEVYKSLPACRKGVQSVGKCAAAAPVWYSFSEGPAPSNPRFEIYTDRSGSYRFRLRARNGKLIGASEPYTSKAGCLGGVESIKNCAPEATIKEE